MALRQALKASARAEMQTLAAPFLDRAFIARHVAPRLSAEEAGDPASWTMAVVRATDTGRITLRYGLAGATVFATAYSDDRGARSYAAHRHLWQDGFGAGAPRRVPEPLTFIEPDRVILMRAAAGTPLSDLLDTAQPPGGIEDAVRRAARWLAQLHATRVPGAATEPPVERVRVVTLGNILGRSAARCPERRDLLLDLLQRLRLLAPDGEEPLVPTHGQFTPRSIYLAPDAVTVIDIDRVCLSDPAKDLAMFVQRARKMALNATGDLALGESLAAAFLDEYARGAGLPASLPYYGAFDAVKRFVECVKDEDPQAAALADYYLTEFRRCEAEGLAALDARGDGQPAERRHVAPHVPTHAGREEIGRWIRAAASKDFIDRFVLPDASGPAAPGPVECDTTVVQDTGTGRLTARCVFPGGQVIFAKLYSDGLGEYSYRLQETLWRNGFGRASPFQVPEPLAFVPEHRLVLMRGASGTPLREVLNGASSPAYLDGARRAARWLGALHCSAVRVGTPEPDWDSLKLFRICVRLVKAAARRPEHLDLVLDLTDELKRHVRLLPERRPIVQTHGRFHHDHVFLDRDSVAVIDLDRSRPTDPSKDVAEFIRVLRWMIFKSGREESLAHAATEAFLAEYLALVPEAAASLAHYWSAFLLLSVLGTIGKMPGDDPRWQPIMDFYLRELQHVRDLRL